MTSTPSAEFFTSNRQRLRELFTGTAPIILTANGLLQRNSDVTYPFRQDSSFWYFTGIDEPDVVLVMDKGKEYLIVPTRDETRAAFDGSIETRHLSDRSGITDIYESEEGWRQCKARLKRVKHVATLAAMPAYIEQHGLYTNPARARLIRTIKKHNPDVEFLDLRPQITRMRMIKQPTELEYIQQAINLTSDVLTDLHKIGWSSFEHEYEVEGAITGAFRRRNSNHAYEPIVASGKNACTLHYIQNSSAIQPTDLLLLDVGAEISHYAADITRTYAVKSPTKRQQQVYDAVIAVQEYAMELIKPGTTMREYEEAVRQFMGEKLRELGLLKSITEEEVRKYYPHATSHFLGLDVHDAADYDRPLEPGMVLTVEPGIYIPEEAIGIRIEDNILVNAKGNTNLSSALPRVVE